MSGVSTTVFLIRHGRTAFNREGVFRGRLDVPLDDVGRAQARATAFRFASVELSAVYTSPLQRARDTAGRVAEIRGLEPRVDEAFNNITLGPWEGRPRAEVADEQPELWRIWVERPEELELEGAETLDAVADRSVRRLDEIVAERAGETFAVVSHRAVLKPLVARVLGMARPWFWRLALEPASVSVLRHEPDRGYALAALNTVHHLADEVRGASDDA